LITAKEESFWFQLLMSIFLSFNRLKKEFGITLQDTPVSVFLNISTLFNDGSRVQWLLCTDVSQLRL